MKKTILSGLRQQDVQATRMCRNHWEFGLFLMLILTAPALLWAETPSTDSASSPQASSLQETGGQVGQAEAPKTATAPVPQKVAGTAYDKNAITVLPGRPGVSFNREMSSRAAVANVETYDQLLVAVRKTKAQSRSRIEKAVEQERVREAWEIGKLIDAHVLQHKERADYGKEVLVRLARDLTMSDSELYRMLEFYRAYPILAHARKLSWSEQESLLAINDAKKREVVAEQAEKENWTRDRLREEIKAITKKEKTSDVMPAPLEKITPVPPLGKPGTYKIILAKAGPYEGELALDLGFSNYVRLAEVVEDVSPFKEGDVLEFSDEQGEVRSLNKFSGTEASAGKRGTSPESQLYTYRAWVNRVLDGDTIEATIDLGFGFTTQQILRFRGIDAPELQTRAGVEAKKFVEKMLERPEDVGRTDYGEKMDMKANAPVLIRTVKSDKYDRYLADVYCVDSQGKEVYLNNFLLEKELAVRVQS